MMKLSALPQFKRDATRFKEIASILAKYGLAHWIDEHEPEFIKNLFLNSEGVTIAGLSPEIRLRMALTELGPTFIKLGQILSTRADLIGPSYAAELTELQSDVPADPPSFVHAILESELGKPTSDLFSAFDDVPVGSASIGQIHRATLKTGESVVVKVQHEDIEEKISTDLDILMALAEMAEKYDEDLRLYQPRTTIGQFKRILLRELDFRRERRNLEQFRLNFESDPTVHIPKPYPEISSRRVLTMEVLEGYSIAETDQLLSDKIDTRELAEKGARIFLNMIFRDSFYHADPHPGNIWVLPGGEIGLLDFGMVGRIDEQTREEIEDMLLAALQGDALRLTDLVIRIGSVPRGLDRQALRADISEFVADYANSSLKDFDLSGALDQMTQIIRNYRILLPTGISLLFKGNITRTEP
jgi:ubiquinone biosynthesis protein